MVYIKSFHLPSLRQEEKGNPTPGAYPYGLFPHKGLDAVYFEPVTLFYGSNGSGKSTLLNVIAEKLSLPRTTPFNTSDKFLPYLGLCRYEKGEDEEGYALEVPPESKIITSEDIFDHILAVRKENAEIEQERQRQEEQYYDAKYKKIQFNSMQDLDRLKIQNAARRQTRRAFVRERTDAQTDPYSNGETALKYFDRQLAAQQLYLLDEPENSLSPKFQTRLAELIINCAYYCGCQFIIATHSPLILSLPDARVYDLDTAPVTRRAWYELENVRVYYDFFKKHEKRFEGGDPYS